MDIVGTGGDGRGTLNISTSAALVTASLGVPIAKHGNRAQSSKSGAADVLAALGVDINAPVEVIEACLAKAGIGYMNAPNHHAAMRFVMPARVELGTRTVFNILGPLTNPAGVKRQLTGAFSDLLLRPMAETLGKLGSEKAWLVHGFDGTDEISIAGPTKVVSLDHGKIREFEVKPADAGLPDHPFGQILGGVPAENVAKMRALLAGDNSPALAAYRDAVAINTAAALIIADRANDLVEGAHMALAALADGRAMRTLETLVAVSNGAADAVPASQRHSRADKVQPVEAPAERADLGREVTHRRVGLVAGEGAGDEPGEIRHVARSHAPADDLVGAESQAVGIAGDGGEREADGARKHVGGAQSLGRPVAAAERRRFDRQLVRTGEAELAAMHRQAGGLER